MHLIFVDDSKQDSPTRPGLGPIVSVGALGIPADHALRAGQALDRVCASHGFPAGEEFKWSPSKGRWMYSNLIGSARLDFWTAVIDELLAHGCYGLIAAEDSARRPATNPSISADLDATCLLLERLAQHLQSQHETALVLADRPGGAITEENAYLGSLYALLREGTDYVVHGEIAIVAATQSRLVRLLQAADLFTSCLTAFISGEQTYAPPVARLLLPLLGKEYDRRGGVSVKLHPDFCLLNLYHWLFEDEFYKSGNSGYQLPTDLRPYANSQHQP